MEIDEHNKDICEFSELFKLLSNPVRLCIVGKLCKHETLNVTYFVNCLDASQSSISQHLQKLKANGVIDCKKDGLTANYYIKDEKAKRIVETICSIRSMDDE